jgi:tetratricopeptide (TPR) repeat protein
MERLVLLSLASGALDRSFTVAGDLVRLDDRNPSSRLSLAVRDLKQGKSDDALAELDKIGPSELATLTSGLAEAWIQFGQGKVDVALKTIAALNGPDWYGVFKDYHTALILDAAGRSKEAVEAIGKAYGDDSSALRVVVGYARIMARAGRKAEAIDALTRLGGQDPTHPELKYLLADINAGRTLAPIASTAATGVAEALYGIGSAIGTDDGPELPAAYLRLAAYLDPTSTLITVALGDVFQSVGRCQDAVPLYESVPPSTHIRRNADLQTGICLETLDKRDQATKYFKRVLAANPNDGDAALELGNNYRAQDRFADAIVAYTDAIKALGADNTPAAGAGDKTAPSPNWLVFYYRGVSFEQSKHWAEAEADLKRALALNPNQASVLNYLGYSWIDRGENLNQALEMIQTAVKLKPNDGYVVDSLGWAYYKLGRYDDAVATMETAVQLSGGDATINDHLGDVYWTIGRKREAIFQWTYARDSSPDKDLLAKITIKLKQGLSAAVPSGTTTHGSAASPAQRPALPG